MNYLKFISSQSLSMSYGFLSIISLINLLLFISRKKILYLYSFITTTIASFFYLLFFKMQSVPIKYRYIDWIITTPILLFELCIISNIKDLKVILAIVLINFLTFALGWFGETKYLNRYLSCFLAFIPFVITFVIITKNSDWNYFIPFFIIIWTFYGLVYLFKNSLLKNTLYNILDCISKGVFSILLI
jgi:bacteriorhodopsin